MSTCKLLFKYSELLHLTIEQKHEMLIPVFKNVLSVCLTPLINETGKQERGPRDE